jgi:hypothetical protein
VMCDIGFVWFCGLQNMQFKNMIFKNITKRLSKISALICS